MLQKKSSMLRRRFFHNFVCSLAALLCVALAAGQVLADPVVTVTDLGFNGTNVEWLVEVAPDPALFTTTAEGTGGSLAVELAFEVTGSTFAGATKNATAWPYDNPGNNPFTLTVTDGVQQTSADVFAALGSEFFMSGDAVSVLTIETLGDVATTLTWGGQTLLGGTANEYTGSRVAQEGSNFNEYTGSLVHTPDTGAIDGDYNWSGQVEQGDLDLVLLNWGDSASPVPPLWTNPDFPPTSPSIDQDDLDGVLLNWGKTPASAAASAAVPEPASALLLVIGGLLLGRLRRNA